MVVDMSVPFHRLVNEIEITIQRRGADTIVKGRSTEATATEVKLRANIQPTKSNDMKFLPQGDMTVKTIKLYTRCEVRMAQEGANAYNADRFIYPVDGHLYEIIHVERRRMRTLMHYKAIAKRVELV